MREPHRHSSRRRPGRAPGRPPTQPGRCRYKVQSRRCIPTRNSAAGYQRVHPHPTSWRAHGTPDPRRSPATASGDHKDELPPSPLDDLGGVGSRRRTRADHGQRGLGHVHFRARPGFSSSPLAQLPRRHALLPDSQPEREPAVIATRCNISQPAETGAGDECQEPRRRLLLLLRTS